MTSGSPPPSPSGGGPIDPPPIDPLLAGRASTTPRPDPPAEVLRRRPSARPHPPGRTPRRNHPAQGARRVALVASLSTTVGLATWIAYGEGAFETEPVDAGAPADTPDAGGSDQVGDPDPPAAADDASDTGVAPDLPADDPATVPDITTADSSTVDTSTADTATADPSTDDTATADPSTLDTTVPEATAAESTTSDPAVTSTDSERTVTLAFGDGTFVGSAEYTEWGDVQVEVTIVDGVLVDVATVQVPSGRRSTPINDRALPLLEAAAVDLQTAELDIVTGATYTSVTYADSLQAALDQAALAAATDGIAA